MKRLSLTLWILLLMMAGTVAQPPLQNVCYEETTYVCDAPPSIAFDAMDPVTVCRGSLASKSITTTITPGQITATTTHSPDCSVTTSTDSDVQPVVVSSTWQVAVGSFTDSGEGLSAEFTPPMAGSGAITYGLTYSRGTVCQGTAENITITKVVPLAVMLESGLTITTQPLNQKANVDETVQFSVVASCDPATYQWSKDGVALTDGGHISGATTATLQLADVTTADVGVYTVAVANDCETIVSATASLTVCYISTGHHDVILPGQWVLFAYEHTTVGSTVFKFSEEKIIAGYVLDTIYQRYTYSADGVIAAGLQLPDLCDVTASSNYNPAARIAANKLSWIVGYSDPLQVWQFGWSLGSYGWHFGGEDVSYRFDDGFYGWGHAVNMIAGQLDDMTATASKDYTFRLLNTRGPYHQVALSWRMAWIRPIERIFESGPVCDSPPRVPAVQFDPASSVGVPITVTMSVPNHPAAVIYYTLDGSDPTRSSPQYTEPLEIEVKTLVKAFATEAAAEDSPITSGYYGGGCPVPFGLVAWWSGEGNMEDRTGRHNGSFGIDFAPITEDVQIGLPVFSEGKVGDAIRSHVPNSGDGRPVFVRDSVSLAFDGPFTIEGWIKPTANRGVVFCRGDGQNTAYAIETEHSPIPGRTILKFQIASGAAVVETSIPVNEWSHVAAVFSASSVGSYQLKLYVNGTLASVRNTWAVPISVLGNDAAVMIGSGIGGDWAFRGHIDELSVYSRPLSDFEINQIWFAGDEGKIPGDPAIRLPNILAFEPAEQIVEEDSRAEFWVAAQGTGLTYKWFRKSGDTYTLLTGPEYVSPAYMPFLLIPRAKPSHDGDYRVVVENALGTVTSEHDVSLVVDPTPSLTIVSHPQSQIVEAGQTVRLTVEARGTETLIYQWRKNGVDITGATGSELVFNSVALVDAGTYRVVVENDDLGPLFSGNAVLTVKARVAPTIRQDPQSQDVLFGGKLVLSVGAVGSAPLSYQWKRDGNNVTGVIQGPEGAILQYETVGAPQNGTYTVTVYNDEGEATSAEAIVNILEDEPPQDPLVQVFVDNVLVPPTETPTVNVGNSVVDFSVAAMSATQLSYQWKRNGEILRGETRAVLHLAKIDLIHAGTYSVEVSNHEGSVTGGPVELEVTGAGNPTLTRVDELKLPANNGAYTVTLQILRENSDAENFSKFEVDQLVSGSLTIDGKPFGPDNHTIDAYARAVWIPPAVLQAFSPAAFTVVAAHESASSSPPQEVHIRQKPKTRLWAWGNNEYGQLGTGRISDYRQYELSADWEQQSLHNVIPTDPRWGFEPNDPENPWWCYGSVLNPTPVLDLDSVISLRSDTMSVDAVSADGQVWQWGRDWGMFGFGKNVGYTRSGAFWQWGKPEPNETVWAFHLLSPSPRLYQQPLPLGRLKPFSGIKAVAGGSLYDAGPVARFALKEDGTLWSWGGGYEHYSSALGRQLEFDPVAEKWMDDAYGFRWGKSSTWYFGLSPRQVVIPQQAGADRSVVEIHTGLTAAIVRCADNSIWWWGIMGADWIAGVKSGFTEIQFGGRNIDTHPRWDPVRLTSFDTENPPERVKQLSVSVTHYLALKEDGTVWEFGYVPSLDPSGAVGIHGHLFSPIRNYPNPEAVIGAFTDQPVQVAGLSNIRSVAAGEAFGVAVTEDGEVWVWGHLPPYGYPYGGYTPPRRIESLAGIEIEKVVTGYQCFLALDKRGLVWGWGENLYHLLGRSEDDYGWTGIESFRDGVRIQGLENVTDIFCSYWSAYAVGTEEQGKPTGLAAQSRDGEVKLTWNHYPGAEQYVVYRGASRNDVHESPTLSVTVTDNTYLDAGLDNGDLYYYAVAAVINGVPTLRSWEVAGRPLAASSAVSFAVNRRECGGVRLTWTAASPSGTVSPPQEYHIIRSPTLNGPYESVAMLKTNYLSYLDETDETFYYKVVAWSQAGTNAVSGLLPAAGTVACLPVPRLPLSPHWRGVSSPDWLTSQAQEGHDELTLRWIGPAPGSVGSSWLFQDYEFRADEEFDVLVGDLVYHGLWSDPQNSLHAWLWSEFEEDVIEILSNPKAPRPAKMAALAGALNTIVSAADNGGQHGSIFTSDLFAAVTLRNETTALLNLTSLSPEQRVQLNRMLLDDHFSGKFAYGPNWGSGLTGFRVKYHLIEKAPRSGRVIEKELRRDVLLRDVKLSEILTFRTDGVPNPIDTATVGYRYSWRIPSSATCKIEVAAMIDGEVGGFSTVVGPVFPEGLLWEAADLRAIGGYEQVYLQWDYSEQSEKFALYVKAIESATEPEPESTLPTVTQLQTGNGWTLLDDELRANRYWHQDLEVAANTWYRYAVVAYQVDQNVPLVSTPVTAQPHDDSEKAPIPDGQLVFAPEASPYDGMVLVEWMPPRKQSDDVPTAEEMLNQTEWQFFVERKLSSQTDVDYQVLTDVMFGLAYLDTDVANRDTYTYRVTAIDQHYNRYQKVAVLKGSAPASENITPSQELDFTLLTPKAGNGYVDLTWSATRANAFTVKHALKEEGPFEIIGNLISTDPWKNPPNTYRHVGAQNGVDHWYLVVATTPTGIDKDSNKAMARPLGTLAPLPPWQFKGEQRLDAENGRQLFLTWNKPEGAASYQLFIRVNGVWEAIEYAGNNPRLLYTLPDQFQGGLDWGKEMFIDFAIRSVTRDGLAGEMAFKTIKWTETYEPSESDEVARLKVGGQLAPLTGARLKFVGPTNLVLSVDMSLPNIKRVTYYDGAEVLGVSEEGKTEFIWFNVPGGQRSVWASVEVADFNLITGPASAVFRTRLLYDTDANVEVAVLPDLSTFQTGETDLQLPGPGMPITLSRWYNSRSTAIGPGDLAVGWTASWTVPSVKVSAPLHSGWAGASADFFGSIWCFFKESEMHLVTATLPDGSEIIFQPTIIAPPVWNSPYQFSLFRPDEITMELNAFDALGGQLQGVSNFLIPEEDAEDFPTSANGEPPWDGYPVNFSGTFGPYTYTDPEGTAYLFAESPDSGATWLLTTITDRNGNSLTYAYIPSGTHQGKLASITHSCGREVTFDYSVTGEIRVKDSYVPGPSQPDHPVLKYILSNNKLTEVHHLTNRTASSESEAYAVTTYKYGLSGGEPANVDRLTAIYDPRGVRVVGNQYGGPDGTPPEYDGRLVQQTNAIGRVTRFGLSLDLELGVQQLDDDDDTPLKSATVRHDPSGVVAEVWEATAEGSPPAENPTASFTYNERGQLETQTDAEGNVKTYGYDSQGRPNYQADELSNSSSVEYNELGLPTKIVDATGKTTWTSYDTEGNPLIVLDPSKTRTEYTYYDPVYRETTEGEELVLPKLLKSETRTAPGVPYKIVTEYVYNRDLESPILGDLLQTIEKEVDEEGYVPRKSPVIVTTYEYDANGNRTAEEKTRTLFNQPTPETQTIRTEYTYDARNRVLRTVILEKTGAATEFTEVQTNGVVYNRLGKVAISFDTFNRGTTNLYDALGNLIETQYPDGTVARTAYNAEGRVEFAQERTISWTAGPASRTLYDAAGRVERVERRSEVFLQRDPAGGYGVVVLPGGEMPDIVFIEEYDDMGELRSTTRTFYDNVGRVQFSVDARNVVSESVYDPGGRRTNSIVYTGYAGNQKPVPSQLTRVSDTHYAYDANGNQTSVTVGITGYDPATGEPLDGQTTTYKYDEANRVIRTTFPTTTDGPTTRGTTYDGLGRRLQETDENGVSTAYSYDFRGLLTSVTIGVGTPQAATTSYAYDEVGNQISQTDAKGRVTKFAYDALGRRTSRTLPDNATETVTYSGVPDPEHAEIFVQRREVTDFRGKTIIVTNDWMDRIKTKVLPAVNDGEVPTTNRYTYSAVGLLARVDQSGQVNRSTYYAYDNLRRLQRKDTPEGVLAYTYDAVSALETIKGYRRTAVGVNVSPGSATPDVSLSYGYDPLGRLDSVKDLKLSETDQTIYVYDKVGNLASNVYPNGVMHKYTYNERNRLTTLAVTRGDENATLLRRYEYTLAPTGLRTGVTESDGTGTRRRVSYEYDGSALPTIGRLTKESLFNASDVAAGTITHAYDLVGNRTQRTKVGVTSVDTMNDQSFVFDARDQQDGNLEPTDANDHYDPNGNSLKDEYGDETEDLYDAENRLIQRGSDKFITYDHDGNRVRKTVGAVTTHYLVDDRNPSGYAQVLAEYEITEPSASGLVGHWRMDDATGSTATDSSGNGRHGTLSGAPLWTNGPAHGALNFDGVNDWGSVADAMPLRLGTSHTIAFWLKKNSEPNDWSLILSKGTAGIRNYSVWEQTGAGKQLRYQLQIGPNYANLDSQTGLDVNRWYHVVCTYNGSAMTLYLNGVLDKTTGCNGAPVTSADPLRFGYAGYHTYLSGAQDDVRLYNRVLTTTEIAGLSPQLKRRYTYGHDLISQTAVGTSTTTHYYGYDGHGSVRMLLSSLTGASTTITDTYDYDAYGQLLAQTGTTANNYLYAGEQWDPSLGMYYNRARYLNPNTGRFWTMDSYEGSSQDPLTLHKYLYCHADPVNRVDPSGLADYLLFWGDEQGVPFEDAAETMQTEIQKRSDYDAAKDKTYIIPVIKFDEVGKALREHKEIKEIYFFVHHSPDVMHLDMVSTAADSNVSKDGKTYVVRSRFFRKETFVTTAFTGWDKANCVGGGKLFIYGCHSASLAKSMGTYLFGREGEGIGTNCYFPNTGDGVYPMGQIKYRAWIQGNQLNFSFGGTWIVN